MTRGRPRIPDEIHRLRGTYRADRHGDPDSKPKAVGRHPACPRRFNKEEKAIWKRLAATLQPLGLLSETYSLLMEQFVEACSVYAKCVADVAERGPVLVSPKLDSRNEQIITEDEGGNLRYLEVRKVNPAAVEARLLRQQLNGMLADMGLKPSSLAKIMSQDADGDDPALELVG